MTPMANYPWQKIAVDFAGPFPMGEYLLVATDEASRYPEVEVIKSTSAKEVKPALEKLFAAHGVPEEIKSDNGPPFNGAEFHQFSVEKGFIHRRVTPLWPESNGQAEKLVEDHEQVYRHIPPWWQGLAHRDICAPRAVSRDPAPKHRANTLQLNVWSQNPQQATILTNDCHPRGSPCQGWGNEEEKQRICRQKAKHSPTQSDTGWPCTYKATKTKQADSSIRPRTLQDSRHQRHINTGGAGQWRETIQKKHLSLEENSRWCETGRCHPTRRILRWW